MKVNWKIIVPAIISFILIVTFIPIFTVKADSNEEAISGYQVSYIYVDIKGAVKTPGVYRITSNTRLFQLVEIAGGLTTDALVKNINLSQKLTDESSFYIPFFNDEESSVSETELININSASLAILDTLPSVGESTAQNIIDYRKNIGSFKAIEDIMNVSGIGEATFYKIKDYICV